MEKNENTIVMSWYKNSTWNQNFAVHEWSVYHIFLKFFNEYKAAKNAPLIHLLLWERNSATDSGTSVSAVASLTNFNTQLSLCLATSSQQRILSSAKYMLASKKLVLVLVCSIVLFKRSSPLKYDASGPVPSALLVKAMYAYADKAPGSTEMYPNKDSKGLSKMLDILYSKFCEATNGFVKFIHPLPFMALISPAAPATLESASKAFHKL